MSTIFALATAKGRSGVAVVRVSGPLAFLIAAELCGAPVSARRPSLRNLRTADGTVLDQALVIGFAAGASFTGEDVVEFQCHGSPAVIDALCLELSRFEATRLAEPGEFTRRALENGCLDLSQVEGLSDLIEAETEAQRKQAFRIMQGSLSGKVEDWRTDLIRAAALIEATIDFADEDVPVDVSPEVRALMAKVMQALQAEITGSFVAERIRDGFEVAIVGAPNVGKSTLLNTLAGRDAAITSEIAGTTRDVIEVRMDLNGLAVTLLDTAGLRKTDDTIEGLGIERALRRAATADLRVFIMDRSGKVPDGLDLDKDDIILRGKSDQQNVSDGDGISGLTGQGVDALVNRITGILSARSALALSAVRQRHRFAMQKAVAAMTSADVELSQGMDGAEIAAMELNGAIAALNSLIGRVGVEDLLDEIFSSFCLGK